jgi:hypothetical protein
MEGASPRRRQTILAVDEEPESDGDRAARRSAYAIAARHSATPSERIAAGKRRRKATVGMWLESRL